MAGLRGARKKDSRFPQPLFRGDDGADYYVTCRRYLDAQGRCPKHWGYRIPARDTQEEDSQ